MKENQIVDIDGFVHVVNGKVICFKPDVLDMSKAEDREEVCRLSVKLYTTDMLSAVCGKNTMCVLRPYYDGQRYMIDMGTVLKLPQDVQEKVRKLVDEYERKPDSRY